jgi:hypothetical protein
LRYGLLGCGGVIALSLTAVIVLVAMARSAARSQNITKRTVEEPLHAPGVEAVPTSPSGDLERPRRLPDDSPSPPPGLTADADQPAAGRMKIDLAQGDFEIRPAAAGEPLRIEAEYDQDRYQLVTRLNEQDTGAWEYEVRFRQTATLGFMDFLAQLFGGTSPRVSVFLPRGVPMDLDLRYSQGGGRVDLGGLWLTEANVSFSQGGGDLELSEPLFRPTESLTIDASMGGGSFRRLGHASPRRLSVTAQMGGGDVDLRGQWVRDCDIVLESRMGGLEVRLPDDVTTRGLPQDRAGSDAAGPTLTFSYSSEMGGIEFRD